MRLTDDEIQGKQGMSYSVRYDASHRRYFAPLLGEIKPDTPHVRRLLEEAGCDMKFAIAN